MGLNPVPMETILMCCLSFNSDAMMKANRLGLAAMIDPSTNTSDTPFPFKYSFG